MRLIVRNLTKIASGEIILDKLSYSFEQGRIYGICGESVKQRSMMLRCISGEERFERGYIRISSGGIERRVNFNDVAFIYENSVFEENLTGREFIKYYIETHGILNDNTDEYLDIIGLAKADRDLLIKYYSDDIIRRLKLLCMYIEAPPIILIEELFTYEGKKWKGFDAIISKLKENHIIITSGDLNRMKNYCDEILILSDGVLVCH